MALAVQHDAAPAAGPETAPQLSLRPRHILIGYSMRSGSTLLSHILGQHSLIDAHSDLSSFAALARLVTQAPPTRHVCVKPMDLFYLTDQPGLLQRFNRFIWITRDPRDSYLSTMESGYAYLFWPPGLRRAGIDTGLLARWERITRRYLQRPELWHLVRYEDLAADPDATLASVFKYLGLPTEHLLPFDRFRLRNGGDYKLRRSSSVHADSIGRWRETLTPAQREVFADRLGPAMRLLGYEP